MWFERRCGAGSGTDRPYVGTLRTAGMADTPGDQWIFPVAITRCEPVTVMEPNP
jgi:hypothetical protein